MMSRTATAAIFAAATALSCSRGNSRAPEAPLAPVAAPVTPPVAAEPKAVPAPAPVVPEEKTEKIPVIGATCGDERGLAGDMAVFKADTGGTIVHMDDGTGKILEIKGRACAFVALEVEFNSKGEAQVSPAPDSALTVRCGLPGKSPGGPFEVQGAFFVFPDPKGAPGSKVIVDMEKNLVKKLDSGTVCAGIPSPGAARESLPAKPATLTL